ncbi:MAG: SEC-C metal-binding domain-containing protein [Isosphaeraceae bacterium]
MKAGRNDPCPCGSGKKYKKCCLAKDQEASLRPTAVIAPPPSSVAPARSVPFLTQQHPKPAGPTAPARAAEAPTPPLPLDPVTERRESRWREFESQNDGGRIAVFLKTLEDAELMTDDLAFEMLSILHTDAVKSGGRTRFAECVGALRERRPEVFDEGSHFYLSWCLLDALAESRQEVVPSLAWELAATAGRDIDTFNRASCALGYHGQLDVLVEALRIAWPVVKSSDNVVPWGLSEFAEKGASHEIFDYLEHTSSPDPADAVLLDRVQFFVEEPREDYLREFIGDLTGKSGREWQADDFALSPPRKRSREDWDTEQEERQTPDQGAINLSRLISAFVGYLRREEGVPFPRGELVRHELYRYFVRRNEGDLDPRPSMLEQALHPNRKLPKPPRPAHPLCPERVTLDVHLGGMMGLMSGLYHSAAALFQAIPAWLRFLESQRLIDAGTSRKVAAELLPLHASLLRIWEQYTDDPLLYRQGQAWLTLP